MSKFISISKDPKALKTTLVTFYTFVILCLISTQVIKLFPNYDLYNEYYTRLSMFLCLIFMTIFLVVVGNLFWKINRSKTEGALVAFIFFILMAVAIDIGVVYGVGVKPWDWINDLNYVLNNNPPYAAGVPEARRYTETGSGKGGSYTAHKVDLKIDSLSFTAKDTGRIKEFLDTYKNGEKVKVYYLPNTNILVSLEK